jgi:membrane-associated protease RseP (regulator of RpoE activity)
VWVNVVLLVATILSVLYSGTVYTLNYNDMFGSVETPAEALNALIVMPLTHMHLGIPFAATLMGILLAHELSHYFVARFYGSPVSLPFFIPLPVPDGLGTMGAVIVQRAPMRDRKAVFDIGVAGPLGGLIVAIPLLILGLSLSEVGTPADFDVPPGAQILKEGDSLLYMGLKYAVKGEILPSAEEDVWQQRDVWLSPVAYAAWAGLLVTMINLIPVGQLDGGHFSYALLGRLAWTLGYVLIGAMIAWGSWLLIGGNAGGGVWLLWSFFNLSLNRRHPLPLNDATKLGWPRVALGVFMFVLFILLLMPIPQQIIPLP